MKKIHEKSPCCGETIWRINSKRRQCSCCKKTWTLWPRKKGRKKKRGTSEKLIRYLSHFDGTSRQKALQKGKSVRTEQKHMQDSLHRYCKVTSWAKIHDGPLIVVPDALLVTVGGKLWTLYCILLRPVNGNKATITKPLFLPGREGQDGGWYLAFDALPCDVRNRIVAMVCDGAQPLTGMARNEAWILQRCYFHLKARLRHYVSTGPLGRYTREGRKIQYLVDRVVNSSSNDLVKSALDSLRELMAAKGSKSLRRVLSGFLRNYEDYRSYLNYPELNLPRTSNSAESLMSIIRRLQRKAHGFSNPYAFFQWVEALCKYHQTIRCNRANHLQN